MLSNYDLEELAIDHKIDNFQVISKDELDNMTFKTNQNFIINMENEHDEYGNFNSGTHWVGLYIPVRGKIFLTNQVKSFEFVRFSLYKPFFLY
jgi:hypothetical protein